MRKTIIRFLRSISLWIIAGGLEVSGVEIPWLGYALIALGIMLPVMPIYPFIKRKRNTKCDLEVKPVVNRREADYERKEHLMWAELQITNKGIKELNEVQVNVTKCLTVMEKQEATKQNEFVIWERQKINPFSIYWSEFGKTKLTLCRWIKLSQVDL